MLLNTIASLPFTCAHTHSHKLKHITSQTMRVSQSRIYRGEGLNIRPPTYSGSNDLRAKVLCVYSSPSRGQAIAIQVHKIKQPVTNQINTANPMLTQTLIQEICSAAYLCVPSTKHNSKTVMEIPVGGGYY